jgi:hypothetical protein
MPLQRGIRCGRAAPPLVRAQLHSAEPAWVPVMCVRSHRGLHAPHHPRATFLAWTAHFEGLPCATASRSRHAWARLGRWLRAHAPFIADTLRQGASAADVAAAEAALGVKLPPALAAILRCDGRVGCERGHTKGQGMAVVAAAVDLQARGVPLTTRALPRAHALAPQFASIMPAGCMTARRWSLTRCSTVMYRGALCRRMRRRRKGSLVKRSPRQRRRSRHDGTQAWCVRRMRAAAAQIWRAQTCPAL